MGIGQLIQRARQIQVGRTTSIITIAVVILLVLGIGYVVYGPRTPSPAEIQRANKEITDRFTKWNKARDEAARKQRSGWQAPPGSAPRPAGE